MTITSGKVIYGRVKKDDDYGINRRADVEISFDVDVGQDAQAELDKAGSIAVAKSHELLGLAPAAKAAPVAVAVAVAQSPAASDKAKLAAAITGDDPAAVTEAPKPRAPRAPKAAKPAAADPAAVEDVQATATTVVEEPATKATDPAAVNEDWEAALPEVTDVDLSTACNRTAKALEDNVPIRHLIAEFAGPPPKQLREVPQAVRRQFLARLDKLVAAKQAKG